MKSLLLKLSMATALLLVAIAVPVSAQQGPEAPPVDNSGQDTAQQRPQDDSGQQPNNRQPEQNTQVQVQERVQQIQREAKDRRAQVAQNTCEQRQSQLETVIPRLTTNSTTLLSTFDTVYERLQSFYESSQLTVEEYDSLIAATDSAQVIANETVSTVESYQFTLDCSNQNIGEQLDGFRLAVAQARAGLNDYRSDLVNLVRVLRAAAGEEE